MCVTCQPLNCVCSKHMTFSRTLLEKLTTADRFCRHVCTRHTAFRCCTRLPKAALKLHPDNVLQKTPLCCLCTIWTGFPQSFTHTASFCGQVCSEYCFDFLSAGKSVRSYRSRHGPRPPKDIREGVSGAYRVLTEVSTVFRIPILSVLSIWRRLLLCRDCLLFK